MHLVNDPDNRLDASRLLRLNHWLERQVADNRLAGASLMLGNRQQSLYFHACGEARAGQPFTRDTVVRLYSMSKPVVSVAAMMLFEQGHFQLDDPIHWYLPAFESTRVWTGQGGLDNAEDFQRHTTRLQAPITVRHIMTHTAGLTYGFMNATPVDAWYREHELIFPGSTETLSTLVDRLSQAPLLCQPGTQWNYSVATDVLGRLIEVWSGQSLSEYLQQHVFQPLGMHETGFHVQPDQVVRFADLYGPAAGGELGALATNMGTGAVTAMGTDALEPPVVLDTASDSTFLHEPSLYSGGGGLIGSIDDYARFCQMLLNGGALEGQRLLGRKTVAWMRVNQLPGHRDLAAMGQAVWSETSYEGIGFGLGFAVVLDPVKAGVLSTPGEHHWGGAASTFFWVDPEEDLFVIFLTQLFPSSAYPLRKELRTAVYQCLA